MEIILQESDFQADYWPGQSHVPRALATAKNVIMITYKTAIEASAMPRQEKFKTVNCFKKSLIRVGKQHSRAD